MTLKHSPGPWTYDSDAYRIMRESDEDHVVAGFDDFDLPTKADGRLMAAAPDMLRLLRAILKNHRAADYGGMIKSLGSAAQFVERLDGDT